MSQVKHKHLIARVDEKFYREVKVQLARKGITMHQAIVVGISKELNIDIRKFMELASDDELVATI